MAGHDSAGLLGWKFAPINAVDHPQFGLDLLALGVERTEEFLVVGGCKPESSLALCPLIER